MNTEIQQTLQALGLNKKEVQIYLQALQAGTSPASVLGQRAKIIRSTAQYTCQQLTQKRLLSAIHKGNTIYYTPEPPEKLLLLLAEEKKDIQKKEGRIQNILGDLERLQNPHTNRPQVRYFQGSDGIIEMFEDVLQSKQPIYGVTRIEQNADPKVNTYIQERYLPERMKNKTPAWILFNDNEKSKEYRTTDPKVNRISLLIPTKEFPFDTCCHIYGNKVAFYSFKLGDSTGVLIENKAIHKTMMSLFRLSWNSARKLRENSMYTDIQI